MRCLLFLLFIFVFFGLIGVGMVSANNADLYLSPSSGTFDIGEPFSVLARLNSDDTPINAAQATINFNPEQIRVVSISKTGSVFLLWPVDPSFSNSTGKVAFAGGSPTAFRGSGGTILQITLEGRAAGSAVVNFSAGMVLAADGNGTNVTGNMSGGNYTFRAKTVAPPVTPPILPPAVTGEAPSAPVITSSTHPDQSKWYANADPLFQWPVPSGITTVRLLANESPAAIPTVTYVPPISEKRLENFVDGVWYLHVQFKNQYGWGKVAHFRFNIDTKPPEPFTITVYNCGEPSSPSPLLYFKTTDIPSGVDYYRIKIDEVQPASAAPEALLASQSIKVLPAEMVNDLFQLPPQAPGKHKVAVEAVDGAGNMVTASIEVAIEEGKQIKCAGAVTVKPCPPLCLLKIFGRAINCYLAIMIILVLIILALLLLIFYQWRWGVNGKKRLKREFKELADSFRKAFRVLREKLEDHVERLDGKSGLTKSEKEVKDKMNEALNTSEDFINKEIKDVEKELE